MTTIKQNRPLIRSLAGLIVFGVALAIIGSISIPINSETVLRDLKNTISQDVGSIKTIDGKPELRFLPHPAIDIVDLNLSFNNDVKLNAPRVSLGLSLMALIGGRYEPISSTLTSPSILIPTEIVPKDTNEFAEDLRALLASPAKTNAIAKISRLETITINKGTFTFTNKDTSQSVPSTMSGTLTFLTDGAKRLNVAGNWRKQDETVKTEIGPFSDTINGGRKTTLFVSNALGSITLSGTTPAGKDSLFAGHLSVDTARIDRVSEWLSLKPPVPFSTSLKIDGVASITPQIIAVSEAQVRLGNVTMIGGVSLDISKPRPLITGTLSAGDMDITSFLTPIWPKQQEQAGWKNSPIDPNVAPDQDLDIRLSAERINLGIVRISNAALSILARERTLNITLASAHMFQGMTKGKISIHPIDQGFSLSSHVAFETIDIGQTTLALMDVRKLEGSISGKFDVESNGRSIDDIMKAMSGKADFILTNGTLSGVNLSTLLRRIETRPLSVVRDMRGGKTDFDTMRMSMRITNGTAYIDASEMLFAPNRMTLNGSVAIGERQLNLVGEAAGPTPQNGAEPAVLAYTITGDFDDPIVTPDINRILKRSSGTAASPD
jgi:uncharacterized protein involved in outer membrane biogenesis